MSFSSEIKNHLIREDIRSSCCAAAELFALKSVTAGNIIKTKDQTYRNRIILLCRKAFRADVIFDETDAKGSIVYSANLGEVFGRIRKDSDYLANDCCKRTYLRTMFILSGTVNSPECRYSRLEIISPDDTISAAVGNIIGYFGIKTLQTERFGKKVTYVCRKDYVADILSLIGANKERLIFDNKTVEKEVNNNVNRIMNCDNSNMNIILETAGKQLEAIKMLRETGRFNYLSKELKETCVLREKYPEYSMSDLASAHVPPISRSGLTHRFSKIIDAARKKI